jgi:hypothetical protein
MEENMIQDEQYNIQDVPSEGVEPEVKIVTLCPPDVCAKMKTKIDQACKKNPGQPVRISLPNGQVCFCECPPEGDPNCPSELCEKKQEVINKYCAHRDWPPGTPVLIEQADGKICKCYCK